MKYDHQTTTLLLQRWAELGADPKIDEKIGAPQDLGAERSEIDPIGVLALEFDVPRRSIIAKLSSLGVYKRKEYTDKRGLPPVKKEKYVEDIAIALGKDISLVESLEKVNKSVLKLILERLTEVKED